jgi:hypothetical protein
LERLRVYRRVAAIELVRIKRAPTTVVQAGVSAKNT